MYHRTIKEKIKNWLFKGKILIIYGARQVGKTTLSKEIIKEFQNDASFFDCDLRENRKIFEKQDIEILSKVIKTKKIIVLDEAQRVKNIGLTLKIIHTHFPETQVIATGSGSFDLSNKINEPLTGRAIEFTLHPLSISEVIGNDYLKFKNNLENILKFGLYPEIFQSSKNEIKERLTNIANNYLYKDILEFEYLKKSDQLYNLLELLALQIGSEVSSDELSKKLGLNKLTIQKYIYLLEKTFVIFRLRSFSRNLRKEISKGIKVFFWDLGIRNFLINNFNDMSLRNDYGDLWENFCIAEKIKHNHNCRKFKNSYFWRTYEQKEIDYIEEADGKINAFEFKWSQSKKARKPQEFLKTYSNSNFQVINKENFLDWIL